MKVILEKWFINARLGFTMNAKRLRRIAYAEAKERKQLYIAGGDRIIQFQAS